MSDYPPASDDPQFRTKLQAWFRRNADRLEDEAGGRKGLLEMAAAIRKHAYQAEFRMVSAWRAATGELPPEGSEQDRLITGHVREAEKLADSLERIAREATGADLAGAVSEIQGSRLNRAQAKRRSAGGDSTAQQRKAEARSMRARIVELFDRLTIPERNRAAVIADRLKVSPRTVRDHLRKAERR